jgi:hypothetical protein
VTGKQTAALLFVLLALACSRSPLSGGSGSEGEARVRGCVVYYGSALPAVNAQVRLRSDSFLMDTSSTGSRADAVTDSFGRFLLDAVDTGGCSIEINDGNGHAVLIRCHVVSDTTLPVYTLMPTGTISGTWETFVTPQAGYFVQIYGLDRIVRVDPVLKTFTISDVPAGIFTLRFISSSPGNPSRTFNNIQLASGQALSLALSPWSSSKRLYLNTTASGAGVSGDIFGFPVLVRLTGSSFDFTAARPDGHDIRFLMADRTLLSYEIERWDAVNQLAEIWVKVDTVFGNDSAQFITMHWGNPDAADSSNGAAVFDTADGFAGVWHLGESSGSIHDATVDHYNGTRNGNQTRSAGAIGYGQFFKDSGDYTDMGNVCNPDTSGFSVCAWIKPAIAQSYRTIVSKSSGGSASSSYGWLLELDNTGGLMAFIATGAGSWGSSKTFVLGSNIQIVDSTTWHHVAAVFDRSGNGKCRLYIDGSDVSSLPAGGDIASIGALVNSAPLRLGADANGGCPWKGSMDECSVSWKVRSPDWVRLCYMNQKQQDALVKW